jgi:hypothetical protein
LDPWFRSMPTRGRGSTTRPLSAWAVRPPGAGPRAHVTLAHGGSGSGAGGAWRPKRDPVTRVWGPSQSVPPSAPSLVFRTVTGGARMAERGLEPSPAAVAALPPEVRAQLAELELELSEGRRRAGSGERAPAAGPGRGWGRSRREPRPRGGDGPGTGNLA